MPELPEVETTRRGIAPSLIDKIVTEVRIRNGKLRWPVDENLPHILPGQRLLALERRAKYLLFRFEHGVLIGHLGMSGSLRIVPQAHPPQTHDHIDLVFGDQALRLRDPRRFGAMLWHSGDPMQHPLLSHLGPEPLQDTFNGDTLYQSLRTRQAAIKLAIMDAHIVVGVGNIYASESLFLAGIRPTTPAHRLSRARCTRLAEAIKTILSRAIEAGGSSLRDFFHADGQSGYFQQQYAAYARTGEACRHCNTPIRQIQQGQRSTFYCPKCQR